MSTLVIDEWLWADLGGANGPERRTQSLAFLQAVFKKCDRVAFVTGSKFERKFWELCESSELADRLVVRFFRGDFLYNSSKTVKLDAKMLSELSGEEVQMVKDDDHYLIQSLRASGAETVVTTDGPLKTSLDRLGIPCELRDTFASSYIARYG